MEASSRRQVTVACVQYAISSTISHNLVRRKDWFPPEDTLLSCIPTPGLPGCCLREFAKRRKTRSPKVLRPCCKQDKAEKLVREAAREGAQIILLSARLTTTDMHSPTIDFLDALCKFSEPHHTIETHLLYEPRQSESWAICEADLSVVFKYPDCRNSLWCNTSVKNRQSPISSLLVQPRDIQCWIGMPYC